MGTLGQYLRSAREALGIDLRDAAQQTRISINYLKALEEEDFSRLPGEVFVKGFLKNYGKFLRLNEFEVMKRFAEPRAAKSAPSPAVNTEPAVADSKQKTPRLTKIEPFLWGGVIVIALIFFVFTALPERHQREKQKAVAPMSTEQTATAPLPFPQMGKLYLEVVALEDTWILVRTDNSPQKKALLKKDESLIWSADERFLLSYGSAKALKLMLNGQELAVNEPGSEVVRDMTIIATGIVNRNIQFEKKLPRENSPPADQPQQPLREPAQHNSGDESH
jgi:transcriptional regulator with XRE-family HTH domain